MYDDTRRRKALELVATGLSLNAASRATGISRAALRSWLRDAAGAARSRSSAACPRCVPDSTPLPEVPYAYLLGLYLGDGCISAQRKGVFSLRITCCDWYPRLIEECEAAVQAVRPGRTFRVAKPGCTDVTSSWKHWPCLFPQHGPGRKHEREIVLEPWQRTIVEAHPGRFLRGLFHSDGCRIINWTEKTVRGERKRYEYPRYFFVNESTDILALCSWALDLVAAAHRFPRRNAISVARRDAVAVLDLHVGPKS